VHGRIRNEVPKRKKKKKNQYLERIASDLFLRDDASRPGTTDSLEDGRC
jgi:hypothetical protein